MNDYMDEGIYDIINNITQVIRLPELDYKRAFIEAKVLVDRHSVVTTTFFVSESTKRDSGFGDALWGADVIASKAVKDNEVIAYADQAQDGGLDKRVGKAIVKGWVKR